jgi:predicted O-linked N-acetylglucosamine transferase (SPINDLY family)
MNEPGARSDRPAVTAAQAMQHAAKAYTRAEWAEAERWCRGVLAARQDYFDALNLLGIISARMRRTEEAGSWFRRAIAANPGNAEVHNNYGNVLTELERFDDALNSYERALIIKPNYVEAHFHRGVLLQALGRFNEALESYDGALQVNPAFAEACNNRGNTLHALKRFDDALGSYERALEIKSDYADAYFNRGALLQALGRFNEALESYDGALRVNDAFAEAYNNRGVTLQTLRRFNEALESYERALQIKPDFAGAHNNRGNTLHALKLFDDALDSYERALEIKSDYADAHLNRGVTLQDCKRFEDARSSYESALKFKPDLDWVYGMWLHSKMQLCEWNEFDLHIANLIGKVEQRERATPPFAVLALSDSLAAQRQATQTWVGASYPDNCSRPAKNERRGERIRIGYYSSDYGNHPVAQLAVGLFEEHDRTQFEVVAFSWRQSLADELSGRIKTAFDRFVDVRGRSDREVAQLSREYGIDIAVDLMGLTGGLRTGIFAVHAAPIQVNFLGYPGTMGAPYMDYIVADPILIPPESRERYTEKIVYLPNSYQANDRKRRISDREFTRAELGLPPTGFVFCCFNNSFKITPNTFNGWMRILKQVEGSVLWLFEENETAADNLRREAEARGVESGRLVFARRMPLPEHLARHRAADLFIDTLPYNAHTTASDALWAGLPVLTCVGESFAGRVAASLLNAVGLPELINATQEQYEAMAVALAGNAARLAELKEKLSRNRLTTPLFDTARFTEHLEDAYTQMYQRHQAGLSPEHIYVDVGR